MNNPSHDLGTPSPWVQRWSHLIRPAGSALDVACGRGRHLRYLAGQGYIVTGVDRSEEALQIASGHGDTVLADIENEPWPLVDQQQVRQFDAVVVTNYLWRALFHVLEQSLAPGGVLLYETFAQGNETVGKPSRSDFLLRPGELLTAFKSMHIIAYEEGFLSQPDRFVQRIAAIKPAPTATPAPIPARYTL
ncbi:bifunctional 2-polyprenyl-6-hydroxyphenol methylase/3-demethylubiquinol 3-O-methyltransferase UbiG [Rhodoferax sp. PAMC 29310]|uniref:class I SAM-dependent methyltransferase n=1 Tax=Rhodoferax sp. PAMC 29310 TaxID=2822760 RepID=UPI001B331C14|nr:class I SAM-dependent methyltransferase [Rhodoferax sp. PAMC 29310]